ncbi:hypothetical protein EYC51_15720 [Alcaligenes faecalis]|uniref:hypothetical protein n=1 Tax=Alcaligenes phenolicus TaxID=232846 RepID=UPI0010336C69|nr:hypothetical protein [Alcaligenes phenolicus]QBH20819.1 hypothetical protein EYC51_15720 [Alcaligenes faecalis]
MNLTSMPGFGDEATWPPCSGHPNDPRTDDSPREAAIDTRAAELLGAPGFTPFDPQNLCEALCETGDQNIERLADLLRQGDTAAAGQALAKLTRDYWEAAARSEAERQINKEAENHPCAGCSSRRCSSCDA